MEKRNFLVDETIDTRTFFVEFMWILSWMMTGLLVITVVVIFLGFLAFLYNYCQRRIHNTKGKHRGSEDILYKSNYSLERELQEKKSISSVRDI